MPIATLKKRADFLRVRGGKRYSAPAFLLEGRPAGDGRETGFKVGFTVTRKLGKAVARNRMRRRLRAAIEQASAAYLTVAIDCVVLARPPAVDRPFELLVSDMSAALGVVTRASRGPAQRSKPA